MTEGNGDRVLDMIGKSIARVEEKLDNGMAKLLRCTARDDERIKAHGKAIGWLYGIVSGVVVILVVSAIRK